MDCAISDIYEQSEIITMDCLNSISRSAKTSKILMQCDSLIVGLYQRTSLIQELRTHNSE
jgi:hypothetical protein